LPEDQLSLTADQQQPQLVAVLVDVEVEQLTGGVRVDEGPAFDDLDRLRLLK